MMEYLLNRLGPRFCKEEEVGGRPGTGPGWSLRGAPGLALFSGRRCTDPPSPLLLREFEKEFGGMGGVGRVENINEVLMYVQLPSLLH